MFEVLVPRGMITSLTQPQYVANETDFTVSIRLQRLTIAKELGFQ